MTSCKMQGMSARWSSFGLAALAVLFAMACGGQGSTVGDARLDARWMDGDTPVQTIEASPGATVELRLEWDLANASPNADRLVFAFDPDVVVVPPAFLVEPRGNGSQSVLIQVRDDAPSGSMTADVRLGSATGVQYATEGESAPTLVVP